MRTLTGRTGSTPRAKAVFVSRRNRPFQRPGGVSLGLATARDLPGRFVALVSVGFHEVGARIAIVDAAGEDLLILGDRVVVFSLLLQDRADVELRDAKRAAVGVLASDLSIRGQGAVVVAALRLGIGRVQVGPHALGA